MNWLIIAPDCQNENLVKIRDFLENKHETISFEVFINEQTSKEDLFDIYRHVIQATHCVIVDSVKMRDNSDYVFVLGALAGKGIKSFIHTGENYGKKYEVLNTDKNALFHCFKDIDETIKAIDLDFKNFILKDNQRQALVQLFTLGIPFTSDCFATYIAKDDDEICNTFVDAGMMINARTTDGIPLLCIAVRNECVSKVKWLIELGADINAVSKDRGYTPVMDAVWRKNLELTEFLIEHGAKLDTISTDGQPILVLAVGNGNVEIVKLLLENGADPRMKDSMGMDAKAYAVLFRKNEIVELLDKYLN